MRNFSKDNTLLEAAKPNMVRRRERIEGRTLQESTKDIKKENATCEPFIQDVAVLQRILKNNQGTFGLLLSEKGRGRWRFRLRRTSMATAIDVNGDSNGVNRDVNGRQWRIDIH